MRGFYINTCLKIKEMSEKQSSLMSQKNTICVHNDMCVSMSRCRYIRLFLHDENIIMLII